jgi:hypothetical protein
MKHLCYILLFLTACATDTLQPACPAQCWAVPDISPGVFKENRDTSYFVRNGQDKVGVGTCRAGVPTCDEDGQILSCEGEVLPSIEICDNLDNDCDGFVDTVGSTYPLTRSKFNFDFDCHTLGICSSSTSICIEGTWTCQYPSTYEPDSETSCDGLDNDCDGLVDEELFLGEYCFDDEFWKATNLPCHPGVVKCQNGRRVCENQRLPTEEVCLDSIDNDCDGLVDNSAHMMNQKYDIVFDIDNSGSMCDKILATISAVSQYVDALSNNSNFRFAIVNMSNIASPNYISLETDFADLSVLLQKLTQLLQGCPGFYLEASIDSIELICSSDNVLNLSWRSDSNKMIFVFTDEPPQTYSSPPTTHTAASIACVDNDIRVYVWSIIPFTFDDIAAATNGQYFPLINNTDVLLNDMNSILAQYCE